MYVFFFNDTATTEIYTLSLHDALPISIRSSFAAPRSEQASAHRKAERVPERQKIRVSPSAPSIAAAMASTSSIDRKSTRLNSSHANISYAVFCLKKKKNHNFNSAT